MADAVCIVYQSLSCSVSMEAATANPMLQLFLCSIMLRFHLCCQADNRKRYKEEENDHLDDQTAADVAWSKHKLLNESIIVALFQGQFKSTVQCLTCHRKSRTFETFMYLSLPLASTSKCSLQVGHTYMCQHYSMFLKTNAENYLFIYLFIFYV